MMKKILVPFDGSETALRALDFAAGIGNPFGSEIMVVNVIVPYDYTKVPPRKPKNAIEEAEMAAKEPDPTPLDIVKGILEKAGYLNVSFCMIVDIDPAERILDYAKTAEADMIVLGNRGMGMLAELLMGSVSTKIS
ncbi:MAG: universal stress protein [Acidaminococcaceae bacterium]|nr:universal stress protein [Acidaminococcaceae bacterium]